MQALSDPQQQGLVDQLREEILTLPARDASGSSVWDLARRRLLGHIRTDDPRCFLRWPEVRATMFVANARYSSVELDALMCHRAWSGQWEQALVEDPCGCPIPSRLAPYTSDNLIHHAYHALMIEEQLGDIRDFDEILEFGGGYGSFLRLIRRMGIASSYHIHDLPEFAALQRYYLGSVASYRREPAIHENLTLGTSLDELPADTAARRLFVAFWSLSEMASGAREPWYDIIARCDGVVIAFRGKFEGTDNKRWFEILRQRTEFVWKCWEIPHVRGNFYLMGRRAQRVSSKN